MISKTNAKNRFLLIIAIMMGALVIAITGLLVLQDDNADGAIIEAGMTAQQTDRLPMSVNIEGGDRKQSSTVVDNESFEVMLSAELIRKYESRIGELAVQASLIRVQGFVLSKYPVDGKARFEVTIKLAFPEYAASILKLVALMEQYDGWLAENYTRLNAMAPLERDGTLWDKRRELFGDSADQIWAEEKALIATKQREVQEIIYQIDNAGTMTLDEKLYQLQVGLNETLGDTIKDMAIDNGLVAQLFFSLDSVQTTLHSMDAEQRIAQLNTVRQQLGFNEAQIIRMSEDDAQRNARWEMGSAYLEERNELMSELEGQALEDAVGLLRLKYFKHEAETIAMEEASGFSRYERPRVYGRN